jgi:Prenylcysteine lyase
MLLDSIVAACHGALLVCRNSLIVCMYADTANRNQNAKCEQFFRYKLSPFATDRLVQKAVHRFGRIYGLQRSGTSFDTSAELWRALDLDWATNITLASYLMSAYPSVFGVPLITERYINEVAAALTRVNYNQSPQLMSALAGLIGLAPDDTTFMVQGGMSQVAQGLLKLSNTTVHLSARVTRVARPLALHGAQQHRHWKVQVAAGGNSTEQHDFDIVVIATPMSTSGIQVQGAPKGWPPPQPDCAH